jgi:hypothetical protein
MSRPLIKGIRSFVVCHRVPPWIEESWGPVPATSPIRGDHGGPTRRRHVAGREPRGAAHSPRCSGTSRSTAWSARLSRPMPITIWSGDLATPFSGWKSALFGSGAAPPTKSTAHVKVAPIAVRANNEACLADTAPNGASALGANRHIRGPYVLCPDGGTSTSENLLQDWMEQATRRAGLT